MPLLMDEITFPASLDGWHVSALTADHKRRAVCRRYGVTLILVGTVRDGWDVTKLQGGRVLAERHVPRIPEPWVRAILAG